MQTYETLLITPPNLPEEEEKAAVEALGAVITDGGGTMHAHDRMGRRHLAYPIQKFDDGVFIRFLYDSESDVPKELERRSRLSDKVLRSLTVRLTTEWAEDAKKQAVLDEQRRVEAEAQAILDAEAKAVADAEAEAKAAAEAAEAEAKAAEAPAEADPPAEGTTGSDAADAKAPADDAPAATPKAPAATAEATADAEAPADAEKEA